MKDLGLVSIITPTYNSSLHIEQTIQAVLSQTYSNWELLITDDCSTDDTQKIVRRYAERDDRIKLVVLPQNSGAGVARNNSISRAKGRYIAFCDSDDFWAANKLERQLQFMHENDVKICYSTYHLVDDENRIQGIVICPKSYSSKQILNDDRMGTLTLIYDADAIPKQLMPLMRKRQDWAMKILLMRHVPMAYGITDEPLAYYRKSKKSLSYNKFGLVKYNIGVYEQVLGYSWLHARLHFLFRFMPTYLLKKLNIKLHNLFHPEYRERRVERFIPQPRPKMVKEVVEIPQSAI